MNFKYIRPDILSKLKDLEELELPCQFENWGSKEEDGQRLNASLDEIESLRLTTLKISVSKGSNLAVKLVKNLTRFHVCFGSAYYDYSEECSAVLRLVDVDAIDVTVSWISVLLRNCEKLELNYVRNLMNIMCLQHSAEDGFPQLKYLEVSFCAEMEYLVEEQISSTFLSHLKTLKLQDMDNLKEIWNFSKIKTQCFTNLFELKIVGCGKMKHVFPVSVAREFRQLKSMSIAFCGELEEIIYNDEIYDRDQVVASSVQFTPPTIETASTPTMNSNINGKPQVICPTLNSFARYLLGREKHPKIVSTGQIVEDNIARKDENHAIVFPRLKALSLAYLWKLKDFYDGNHAIELPELEVLEIDRCNKMEALSYGSFYTPILKLFEVNNAKYYPTAREDLNAFLKKTP
ncbi:uncharacterized protein [Euphorbia lathyris]|uniref:uncharacterized protein isoform X2 n=1 Tax=Euphorbia lathyris TaxID=212925 RepID=UPI003314171B